MARIERNDGIALDDRFIPRITRIGASASVMERLGVLVKQLEGRQGALREVRHDASPKAQQALFIISSHLPVLRHLAERAMATPEELYVALIALRGAFSIFARRELQEPPAAFDDGELTNVLHWTLDDVMTEALGIITPYDYGAVALERRDDGMFLGAFHEPEVPTTKTIFLRLRGPEEALNKAPRFLKIASWTEIGALLSTSSAGVQTHAFTGRLPRNLRFLQGTCVRTLDVQSEAWAGIVESRTVAAYAAGLDGLELCLYYVD